MDDGFDFDRFYLGYRKAVLKAAFEILADWQKAEDVAQEAFSVLYQRLRAGELIQSPKGFIQTWAYFLALEQVKPCRKSLVPTDPGKINFLVDRELDLDWMVAASFLEIRTPEQSEHAAWEGLCFWGHRLIDAALRGAPPSQKLRLFVLLDSASRSEALERLQDAGRWNKSSISMTLARYSEKIDHFLASTLQAGPCNPAEDARWGFLEELCRQCPGLRPKPGHHQSTLSWILRGLHHLDRTDRHELVCRLFGDDLTPVARARDVTASADGFGPGCPHVQVQPA